MSEDPRVAAPVTAGADPQPGWYVVLHDGRFVMASEKDIRGYLISHTAALARNPYGWSTEQIKCLLNIIDGEREARQKLETACRVKAEPSERDQDMGTKFADTFDRWITTETNVAFWSECNCENELAERADELIATAREEGRREAIEECAKMADEYEKEVLPVDPGGIARLIAFRCRALAKL